MTENPIYKKLPGRGAGGNLTWVRIIMLFAFWPLVFVFYSDLWFGSGFLLSVDHYVISENYRRFYFRNIQAITVQQTLLGRICNIAFTTFIACIAILASIGLLLHWPTPLLITMVGFLIFFLILLLINLHRGPTCECHIYTPFQVERLHSINRMKAAAKVIPMIKTKIEELQGEWTAPPAEDEGISLHEARVTTIRGSSGKGLDHRGNGPTIPLRKYTSKAHLMLFSILLVDVCHSCALFFFNSLALSVTGLVLAFALFGSILTALARQHRTNLPRSIKVITWCSMAYFVLLSYVDTYYSLITQAGANGALNAWERIVSLSKIATLDSPFMTARLGIVAVLSLCLGLLGFLLLNRFSHREISPPPIKPVGDDGEPDAI